MEENAPTQALPQWPGRTIAVLSTVGDGPHAIPVSAPVRSGDRRILISLRGDRGSLARLRANPLVALAFFAEDDVAFTARGRARVLQDAIDVAPEYAAVAVDVDHVDDHRQEAFAVDSGIGRRWIDEDEQRALRTRVEALGALAGS